MRLFILKILGIILSIFVFLQFIPPPKVTAYNPYVVIPQNKTMVIAHGGAKQLFPENTMVAFDGSAKLGVDMLEMDVSMTKDGILVTHHDATIDRMSNGKGYVADFTYSDLLNYNFGYGFKDLEGNFPYRERDVKLPKLEEVFDQYGHMPMVVELKDEGELGYKAADRLKQLIQNYSMDHKIIVASFHDDVLAYFKTITNNRIKTSTAKNETTRFVKWNILRMNLFYRGNDTVIQIPVAHSGINLAKKSLIAAAHKRNMAVHYWTINDVETMKRLIELGADGIITDRPDLMKDVLKDLEQ